MGKSNRSKGSSNIGKGKVTPTQIAFIVDRYLYENRFSETRNLFRNEASSLFSKSPVRGVPESLIPLDDILNEYICLKEQKVYVDHEKVRLDHEKIRVQNLLQGMQNVMNTYNSSLIAPPRGVAPISQPINYGITSSGYAQYNTPGAMPVSLLGSKRVEFGNFSTPMTNQSITRKRKGPVGAPRVSRKPRTTTAQANSTANETNKIPHAEKGANSLSSQTPFETQTLAKNNATNELMTGDGSSVVKCVFNKADSSIPTNSTCLRTPQKHASSPGSENSNSPQKQATPTNCTIVTKERFTMSPLKQITSYTVERSHLISSSSPAKSNLKMSNKRRLNFDDTDTERCLEAPATAPLVATSPSGSDPEVDLFDMDFSNMDFLGENFSISELLVDFDLGCEGSTLNAPMETVSGLSPEPGNGNLEPDQTMSEYTTTVNEVIKGKDMITQGDEANTAATKVLNEMHTDLESCQKLQAENDR